MPSSIAPQVRQLVQRTDRGKVRLGTHDLYPTRALTPLLEAYTLSYPKARLEVICDHRPDHLESLVEGGQLDIALVEMPALSDGGLRLGRDQLVWVRGEAHPLQPSAPLPLAVFPEGCYYRDWALRLLVQQEMPYRIAFTSHSRASILAAVRGGIGIGVIPRATLESGMVIINEGFATLPQTDTTLFVAASANEATARLARTIEESLLLRNDSRP